MREYTVMTIHCPSDYTLATVISIIREKINAGEKYFAFNHHNDKVFSKAAQKRCEDIGLERFRIEQPDTASEFQKECSYFSNRHSKELLSDEDYDTLVDLFENLSSGLVFERILGFDEIEWDGEKAEPGRIGHYNIYLSNMIEVMFNKTCIVKMICEARFRTLPVVQEFIASLGKIVFEQNYFAPEGEEETANWNRITEEEHKKFNEMMDGIKDLRLVQYEPFGNASTNRPINVRKIVKQHLCDDGWSIRKNLPDEDGIMVSKDKGDAVLSIKITKRNNGHSAHMAVIYRSKIFRFILAPRYRLDNGREAWGGIADAHEDQIEEFIKTAKVIRDYVDSCIDDFQF